jgi:uncharacterized SAM-binding protein YcdF (DUF218 family)
MQNEECGIKDISQCLLFCILHSAFAADVMYYLVAALLRPFILAWLALVVMLIAIWRRQTRRRLIVLSAAAALLFVVCLPVSSRLALGSLEWPYPPLRDPPADASAIVVLSGSLRRTGEDGSRFELGVDTLYRCLRAAELYRAAPRPVLVSGGKVHATDPGPPPAVAMQEFLLSQGVRPADLIVEADSHTTYENAVQSRQLLQEKGLADRPIILVTDGAHMRRALGCFRKQGLDVLAFGCRYRAIGTSLGPGDFVPDPSAAVGVEEAAHEWLGCLWYWLTDKF